MDGIYRSRRTVGSYTYHIQRCTNTAGQTVHISCLLRPMDIFGSLEAVLHWAWLRLHLPGSLREIIAQGVHEGCTGARPTLTVEPMPLNPGCNPIALELGKVLMVYYSIVLFTNVQLRGSWNGYSEGYPLVKDEQFYNFSIGQLHQSDKVGAAATAPKNKSPQLIIG